MDLRQTLMPDTQSLTRAGQRMGKRFESPLLDLIRQLFLALPEPGTHGDTTGAGIPNGHTGLGSLPPWDCSPPWPCGPAAEGVALGAAVCVALSSRTSPGLTSGVLRRAWIRPELRRPVCCHDRLTPWDHPDDSWKASCVSTVQSDQQQEM